MVTATICMEAAKTFGNNIVFIITVHNNRLVRGKIVPPIVVFYRYNTSSRASSCVLQDPQKKQEVDLQDGRVT